MANKQRLIDADALDNELEALKVRFKALGRDNVVDDYNFVQTVLLTAPTVDAVEVVHGRWIGPTRVDANNNKYECSECGFWGVPGWAACPKCTAKMDGGVSDG